MAETKRQALTQITGPGLARGISHGKSAIATGKVINIHLEPEPGLETRENNKFKGILFCGIVVILSQSC